MAAKSKKKSAVKSVTVADIKKKTKSAAMAARSPDPAKAQQKLDAKWEKFEKKTDKQLDKQIKKNTKKLEKMGAA